MVSYTIKLLMITHVTIAGENMTDTIQWLLSGPAWIRYNTFIHLLDKKSNDPQTIIAYDEMMKLPMIRGLLSDVCNWEQVVLKRHNDASHPIHKLSFLADIGVSPQDVNIQSAIKGILKHRSDEGPFQVLSNYPTNFGGSGEDEWLWCLCDAPILLYILIKFGLGDDQKIISAHEHLESLIRDNGWPCSAAKALNQFRGPGKKGDPCPYANLIMLKTTTALNSKEISINSRIGFETILDLWENSREKRPYLFKMGTDFQKLKVPFVWYDILHVLNVLSYFKEIHLDPRFLSMLTVVLSKAGPGFKFSSESIWTKWKGWEFCQKKDPSMWVTFSVLRIQKRVGSKNFD